MKPSNIDDDFAETSAEVGYVPYLRNIPRVRKPVKNRPPRAHPGHSSGPQMKIVDPDEKLEMTYKASRYEAVWLVQSLEILFQQKWFDDVLHMVKGGKEASVYLCKGNATSGETYLAAKVYRPRQFRNLRNDSLYREGRVNLDESGREITNKGLRHAIHKRTEFGRELLLTSWLEHEFQALDLLSKAGADVPRPFATDSNTILMSYYGDEIMGAPTLNDISLPVQEARSLFDRVLHNIDLMLSKGRIHGDLSAYNILYWEGKIAIIDFPQAVSPDENRSAYHIFERDVLRVCEYFQRQGVNSQPRKLAAELWQKHQHVFIPLIDPKAIPEDRDDERDIWEGLKNS